MRLVHNLILILIVLFAFCSECNAASSRRTGTNEAILTYGDATRDYQEGGLTTWEQLTDIALTSGISKVTISNLSDYFHAGETLNFAPSGATATFIGWGAGKTLSSATIYYKVISGTPTTSDTITGAMSGHTADVDTIVSANTGCSPVLECYDDQASYNDFVSLSGATTSSSYFRIIRPAGVKGEASWQGHDGTPNNGVHFIYNLTDAALFNIAESYAQIQDLIATLNINSATTRGTFLVQVGQNIVVADCIACNGTNTPGAGTVIGFYAYGTAINPLFVNCLAHNNDGNGFDLNMASGGQTHYIYNCSSTNNVGRGFQFTSTGTTETAILKNCLASDSGMVDFYASGVGLTKNVTYCASKDLTATTWGGTGNRTGCTFSFVNSGNDDFHLLSTDDDALNLGTSLAADAIYPFDDDIDFQTRSTWDIGFDDSFLFANTRDKRASVINMLMPFGRVLPTPGQ